MRRHIYSFLHNPGTRWTDREKGRTDGRTHAQTPHDGWGRAWCEHRAAKMYWCVFVDCPANFTYIRSLTSCYHVVLDKLQWSQANYRCISLHPDAHLVGITSPAKQTIASGLLFRHSCKRSPANVAILKQTARPEAECVEFLNIFSSIDNFKVK